MQVKRHLRVLALTLSATALFTTLLPAATMRSEKVSIPFSFEVQHSTLPAGDYRIQEKLGSGFATIVNVKTGQQADVICTHTPGEKEKLHLVFVSKQDGKQHLKAIS